MLMEQCAGFTGVTVLKDGLIPGIQKRAEVPGGS
jgi:hypothetical protein